MSIITISRGTFSGGKALAECLSGRLGYPCVSREVIVDAASEYGISLEKLTAAMEKPPSFWEQLTGERTAYLHYVRAALYERALGGNLVYHGHAGHLLLRDVSPVIRIRVIAGLEFRIKEAMERLRIGRKEARARIREYDLARVKWTRFLYNVDWYDASLFDVVVNVDQMGIECACEVVARTADLDCFKPTPESQRVIENLTLSSRVWAALAKDPSTWSAEVEVTADDGIVTITGSSRLDEVIRAIPTVAGRVEGVQEVRCHVGLGSVYTR